MRATAIILAGGNGSRMNLKTPKQRLKIAGETVLERCLKIFQKTDIVTDIILVSSSEEFDFSKGVAEKFDKVRKIVIGGNTRAESAKCGFEAVDFECDLVAIHDACRCLVRSSDIEAVISDALKYGGATASTKITDTVKLADSKGNIEKTVDREALRAVQTPQAFRYDLYKIAISNIKVFDEGITDDNSLFEKSGFTVHLTETDRNNVKITYKSDIEYAKFLLESGICDD